MHISDFEIILYLYEVKHTINAISVCDSTLKSFALRIQDICLQTKSLKVSQKKQLIHFPFWTSTMTMALHAGNVLMSRNVNENDVLTSSSCHR